MDQWCINGSLIYAVFVPFLDVMNLRFCNVLRILYTEIQKTFLPP